MALTEMREMLRKARREGYAVGGFNAFNAETAQAVVEEGMARKSPILFIGAPLEIALLGAAATVAVVKAVLDTAGVDACLHLDHAGTFEQVKEAIDCGFMSVMIDGSALPFADNVGLTKKVVEYAHPRGVSVEAELGAIGRADDLTIEGAAEVVQSFTDPDQAREFAEATGCDFLAVSIGNAHGFYKRAPELAFGRLGDIAGRVDIPLVLHGGSGIPEDQLRKAVALGIAKVNVASEIARAFTEVYMKEMGEGKTWWAAAKLHGKNATRGVIGRWMHVLGSEGKA